MVPVDEKVVNAPTDVASAGIESLIPPGVDVALIRVKVSEGIDPSVLHRQVDPGSLLREKAGCLDVLLRPRDVDLAMCGVDIATEDHWFTALLALVDLMKKCLAELQLVLDALRPHSAIREIHVVE